MAAHNFAPDIEAPVAQLDRVPGYEPGGREFESLRAHHIQIKNPHLLRVFCCLRSTLPPPALQTTGRPCTSLRPHLRAMHMARQRSQADTHPEPATAQPPRRTHSQRHHSPAPHTLPRFSINPHAGKQTIAQQEQTRPRHLYEAAQYALTGDNPETLNAPANHWSLKTKTPCNAGGLVSGGVRGIRTLDRAFDPILP